MRCPTCKAKLTTVGSWHICAVHGPIAAETALADEEALRTPAEQRVLTAFPAVVARAYLGVLEPDNAAAGLKNLLFCVEATLQAAALVAGSQFLRGDQQIEACAKALRRLQNPAMDAWITAVATLGKHLHGARPESGWPAFAAGGPLSAELHDAMRAAMELRSTGGEPLLVALQVFRNKQSGHSHGWAEAACRQLLTAWRPELDRLLAHFEALGEVQLLTQADDGVLVLNGVQPRPASREQLAATGLAEALANHEVVALGPQGGVLPLVPLFAAGSGQGDAERQFAYFGHDRMRVTYYGALTAVHRKEPLAELLAALAAKRIDPQASREEFQPWNAAAWARTSSAGTLELLRGVKYLPDTYVDRAGVDDAVRHWLGAGKKAALLLAADAGAGKTSLLCRLAEERLGGAESDAVLLVLGGDVQRDADAGGRLFARIRTGLGLASEPALAFAGFAELLEAWRVKARRDDQGAERRLVLLVDAVNEGNDPASLLREATQLAHQAGEVNRKAGRVWVRLCLSIRAEYVFALRERDAGADAPPFPHAQEFESHRDEMGKHWPWLTLRPFSEVEAAEAYALGRAHLAGHCETSWEELEGGARRLLHHPLRQRLFHEAFAGQVAPVGMAAETALWSAWLGRVFAGDQGAVIRELALELADACIDAGQNALPPEFVADRRAVWQRAQEAAGQPVAGEMDPVQQLAAAGLLRRAEDEGYDWLADALAEVVFELALLRRDPEVSEASLVAWAALPLTGRLHGALMQVGIGLWRAGRGEALLAWLGGEYWRVRHLLGEIVLAAAPLGRPDEIAESAGRFAREVEALCAAAVRTGVARSIENLNDALIWHVGDNLKHRMGAVLAVVAVRRGSVGLAEALSALEPGNTRYLGDLWVSYNNVGDLGTRSDHAHARVWFEKALAIAERLATLEPNNPQYLRKLSISYGELGVLDRCSDPAHARLWLEKTLALAERLAAMEPDNIQYLRDLSISYDIFGMLDEPIDPARARLWFEKALAIRERLVALEPDNPQYLRDLSISHNNFGNLDQRIDPARARVWFEKGLAIRERLAALEPDNTQYLRGLSHSYFSVGKLDQGIDPGRARVWFEMGMTMSEHLAALEPDNSNYLDDLWFSYDKFGHLDLCIDPGRARLWFEKAVALAERLTALEPDNSDYLSNLSLSYNNLGDLDMPSDPTRARVWFEKGLTIAERLAALEPDNTEHLRLLSILCEMLGKLDQGFDSAGARVWFEKGMATCERLAALEPDNSQYLRALSISYTNLGDLDQRSDPRRARVWFEKDLAIAERLAALEPDNAEYLRGLSVSYNMLGDLDKHSDPGSAWVWFERGLTIAERLTALEPDNAVYLRDLSVWYDRLGDLDLRCDPARARVWFERGLTIAERLTALEPDNAVNLLDLSVWYDRLGDLDLRGDPARARVWIERRLIITERLSALEPDSIALTGALGINYAKLADVALQLGDSAEERRYAMRFAAAFRKMVELDPDNISCHYNLACALARSDDAPSALTSLQRAAALGWTDADSAAEDADLASLHTLPEFQAILDEMRERARNLVEQQS